MDTDARIRTVTEDVSDTGSRLGWRSAAVA